MFLGCLPANYGTLCNKICPKHCLGPCDLKNGTCTFGCLNGWIGDKCDIGRYKTSFSIIHIYVFFCILYGSLVEI